MTNAGRAERIPSLITLSWIPIGLVYCSPNYIRTHVELLGICTPEYEHTIVSECFRAKVVPLKPSFSSHHTSQASTQHIQCGMPFKWYPLFFWGVFAFKHILMNGNFVVCILVRNCAAPNVYKIFRNIVCVCVCVVEVEFTYDWDHFWRFCIEPNL